MDDVLAGLDVQARDDGRFVVRGPAGTSAFVIDTRQKAMLDDLRDGHSVSEIVRARADEAAVFQRLVALQSQLAEMHAGRARGIAIRLALPAPCIALIAGVATLSLAWGSLRLFGDNQSFAPSLTLPAHFAAALAAVMCGLSCGALLQAALLNARGLHPQRVRLSLMGAVPHLALEGSDWVSLPRPDRLLYHLVGLSMPAGGLLAFSLAGWNDSCLFCFAAWLGGLYPLRPFAAGGSSLTAMLGELFGDDDLHVHALHYHKQLLGGDERHRDEVALAVCLVACFAWLGGLLFVAGVATERWPAVSEFPLDEARGVLGLVLTALVMGGIAAGVLAALGVSATFAVQALGPVLPARQPSQPVEGPLADVVRRNPLLAGMRPQTVERLTGCATRRAMAAGDVLLRQGEEGDAFFIIAQGEVEVERDGRTLKRLGSGDFFGELALLAHQPRNATVVAISTGTLLVLTHDDFWRVLSLDPQLGATVEAVAAWRRRR